MSQKFLYYALTASQKLAIGKVTASGTPDALQQLRGRYKSVLMIEPAAPLHLLQRLTVVLGREERLILVKNLHVILKSGVPIDEAMTILQQQDAKSSLKKILSHILKQVRGGNNLSSSFNMFPRVFDSFFVNMIYVGEKSGTLVQSLEYLAQELESNFELHRKVKSAALYPGIILSMTLILGGGLIHFILPKLVNVFDSIHTSLPLTTMIFLDAARFLERNSLMILTISVAVIIVARLALYLPTIKILWIKGLLHLPILGPAIRNYNLTQLTRTLGILLESGTPLVDALEISARTTNNLYYKIEILKAREQVSQGSSLGEALARNKQFTVLASRLVAIGEKSGNLEDNLLYLSQFFASKIDYLMRNISTIIEPALLIVIGLTVGFVAIAVISPIYEFTASVGA